LENKFDHLPPSFFITTSGGEVSVTVTVAFKRFDDCRAAFLLPVTEKAPTKDMRPRQISTKDMLKLRFIVVVNKRETALYAASNVFPFLEQKVEDTHVLLLVFF
jgi:hypothetical protein